MTADFAYDPVTAIDEAKAVGETAALFAEIRQVMRIPLAERCSWAFGRRRKARNANTPMPTDTITRRMITTAPTTIIQPGDGHEHSFG
jgi:hypothetical protein